MVVKHNGMLFPARNDIEYVWDTKYAMGTKKISCNSVCRILFHVVILETAPTN